MDWREFARNQAARFWSHTNQVGECLEWLGACDKDGYGKFYIGLPRKNGKQQQKTMLAHRLALWLSGVDVKPEQLVLHSCDNPRCVNPKHLRTGTQLENRADAVARGRTARGERHPRAKLTWACVREIRRRVAAGERRDLLAIEFGISYVQLCAIVRGDNWIES